MTWRDVVKDDTQELASKKCENLYRVLFGLVSLGVAQKPAIGQQNLCSSPGRAVLIFHPCAAQAETVGRWSTASIQRTVRGGKADHQGPKERSSMG